MKRTFILAAIACALGLVASPKKAVADCRSDCLQDFPNACYNVKDYKWRKSHDGVAHVRVRNRGSFHGAFDWSVEEINRPHVGDGADLRLHEVSQDADIKVWDDPNLCDNDVYGPGSGSYCGFWGLTRTYRSGGQMTRAVIWLAVDEMNENTRAADHLVRKQTMLHEFLHALGLNHSCVNDNHTMWPCGMPNRDYVHVPYMKGCDADGLIHLYGRR